MMMRIFSAGSPVASSIVSSVACATFLGVTVVPNVTHGQDEPSRNASPIVPGFPWVAADTGRMAPGWREFSRYTWLRSGSMCQSSAEGVAALLERRRDRDTISYAANIARRSPAAAREVAEACLDTMHALHADLPSVTPEIIAPDVLTLIRLAVIRARDSEASALLATYLASPRSLQDQLQVLSTAFEYARAARPQRMTLLEDIMKKTDALGNNPNVTVLRYFERQRIAEHWIAIGDTAQARRAIGTVVQLAKTPGMPAGWASGTTLESFLNYLLNLLVLQGGARNPHIKPWLNLRVNLDRTGDSLAVYTFQSKYYGELLRRIGESFHGPDSAVHWYDVPQHVAASNPGIRIDSAHGIPSGQLALVWRVDQNCGESCYEQYQLLRNIHRKYGARGLDVILVAKTVGYSPMIAGALTPDREADAIRAYFQDQLKIPAKIVVEESPHRNLPDGRRVTETTPWERRYQFETTVFGEASVDKFLVDRDRKIRLVEFGVLNEPVLDLYITKYLPSLPAKN